MSDELIHSEAADYVDPQEAENVIAAINQILETVENQTIRDYLEETCLEISYLVCSDEDDEDDFDDDDDYDDDDDEFDDDDDDFDDDEDYDDDEEDDDFDDEDEDDFDEEEDRDRSVAA